MAVSYKRTLYACYLSGAAQAIIANIAPLFFVIFKDAYGLNYEMLGRLILFNFTTQFVVDYFAARYIDKIGYKAGMQLAMACMATGLLLLGVLPIIFPGQAYVGLCAAVMVMAVGGGLSEVLVSPIVDSLPNDAKAASMSLSHSFYSWGQVAVVLGTTLLVFVLGAKLWFIIPILWTVVPIISFIMYSKAPIPPTVAEHERMSLRSLLKQPLFLLALVLMICAGASELSMVQWSSLFAEKALGVSKITGDLLGPCMFAVFMGLGRLVYGIKGQNINITVALIFSAILCVICYLLTSLSQNPYVALFACGLCGLSVALMWPGAISLTARSFPKGGTLMFGMLALGGDIGCSVGPWSVGLISDAITKASANANMLPEALEQLSLKTGLLFAVIFPIILILGTLTLHIYSKRKNSLRTK